MHSPGMLAGGIVLTSLAPIVFYAGVLSNSCGFESNCDNDQRLLAVSLASLVLLGVGIPMIVTGARRESATKVSVGPWVSPQQAGLQLRLRL